jgi:hypothetical protein
VEVCLRHFTINVLEHVKSWNDVKNGDTLYASWEVKSKPMRHSATAIVACNHELVMAEQLHNFRLILRHRALAVGLVKVIISWRRAVTVPA